MNIKNELICLSIAPILMFSGLNVTPASVSRLVPSDTTDVTSQQQNGL